MIIKKVQKNSGCSLANDPSNRTFFFTVFSFASNKTWQYWSCRGSGCVFSVTKVYSSGKRNTNKKRCNDFANLLITITVFFIFVFFITSKKKCQSCNHNLQMNFQVHKHTKSFHVANSVCGDKLSRKVSAKK